MHDITRTLIALGRAIQQLQATELTEDQLMAMITVDDCYVSLTEQWQRVQASMRD